jgi:hypothetical protein
MDKALETTYAVPGVTRVVRTEPTGSAQRTQAAHTKACKAAFEELYLAFNAELLAAIDESIANPPNRVGVERYRKDQKKFRARIVQRAKGLPLPDPDAWKKPAPKLLPYSPGFNLDDHRAPEPEPGPAPVEDRSADFGAA